MGIDREYTFFSWGFNAFLTASILGGVIKN